MIIYDDGLAYLTFHFMSGSSKRKESFVAKPILLQFHPKESNKIVKIHFAEKAPKWMKAFAVKNLYALEEFDGEQVGFALTGNGSSYSVNPLFKGIIYEWFNNMNESMHHFRDTLLNNSEIVRLNLINRSSIFEELGLYYRIEEFEKRTGALCYGDWCHLFDFGDLPQELQQKWIQLINDLTLPGDFLLEVNDETIIETTKLIETNNSEKGVTDNEKDSITITSNDLLIETDDVSSVEDNRIEPCEQIIISSDDLYIEESNGDSMIILDNLDIEIGDNELDDVVNVVVEIEQGQVEQNLIEKAQTELKVATYTSKKEGIIKGQTLLF